MLCSICKEYPSFPIKLPCDHTYCYICAINTLKGACIECHKEFDQELSNYVIDFHITNNTIWLYSAHYNNLWWCYDDKTSKVLENAYQDYQKRMNLVNNKTKGAENEIDVKTSIGKDQINKITQSKMMVFSPINFIKDQKQNIIKDMPISYEFTIGTNVFLLDFNGMFQINVKTNMKRQIRRIVLDGTINNNDKWKLLKEQHNVRGIAGIVFRT